MWLSPRKVFEQMSRNDLGRFFRQPMRAPGEFHELIRPFHILAGELSGTARERRVLTPPHVQRGDRDGLRGHVHSQPQRAVILEAGG